MRDLSHITKKFYNNEEERLRKQREKSEVVAKVGMALEGIVQSLYMRKIRLFIFESNEDASPPFIHCGLFYCCGSKEWDDVDDETYDMVEEAITKSTIYKKVIWEDRQ